MQRITRRGFLGASAGLLVTGAFGVLMGGCKPAAAPAPTAAPQAAVPEVEEPVVADTPAGKVRFLERHNAAFGMVWDRAISVFNERYPDVEVERIHPPGDEDHKTKLLAMVAGGDAPDVHWTTWDWVAQQKQGVYRNISPFMEADPTFDIGIYEPSWIDMWRQEDGVYGLPWDAFIFMLFYNKEIFDEKGLPYPDPNEAMTWQEVLATGQKIAEWDGARPITLGTKQWVGGWGTWWSQLTQAIDGWTLFDPEITRLNMDQPEVFQVLDWFGEWVWKHKVEPTPAIQTDIPMGFPSGKLGMAIMAVCQWSHTREQCDFEWDVAPYPQWEGASKKGVLGWVCPVNMVVGENPENAYNFIKSVCGPEAYIELYDAGMSMPTLKEHVDPVHPAYLNSKPPENNQHTLEWAQYLQVPAPWNNAAWVEVLRIVNDAVTQVYLGEMTAEEALMDHAVPEANKVLTDMREAGTL